jgi:hypothetical protein
MSSIALLGCVFQKKNLTTSFGEEKIPLDNVLSKYA